MSVVRVHCRDLRPQFHEHSGTDSRRPLQSHLTTFTKPLHADDSSFCDPDRRVVALGCHLGCAASHWLMGKVHWSRFPGKICCLNSTVLTNSVVCSQIPQSPYLNEVQEDARLRQSSQNVRALSRLKKCIAIQTEHFLPENLKACDIR